MKIRTRLLLSLLPALFLGLALIAALLTFAPPSFAPHILPAIFCISLLLFFAAFPLYLMAGKIARPIKRLNNSALEIAAGQYGKSIQLNGPQELGELANTLNTMSECLLEHINSLKEKSIQEEAANQEAACARLLQQHLLQKSIDGCASDAIALKAISFASPYPKGLRLNYPPQPKPEHFALHLLEAKEEGIDGMYELLVQHRLSKPHPGKSLSLLFNWDASLLRSKINGFPSPLFWSYAQEEIAPLKGGSQPVRPGDFLFLMNPAFFTFFKGHERIAQLIAKVLNVFGDEGLETCSAMLQKEIAFLVKRRDLEDDLHLICVQILNHST